MADFLGMQMNEEPEGAANTQADYLGANVPTGLDARSGLQDQGAGLALGPTPELDLEGFDAQGAGFRSEDRIGGEMGGGGQPQQGGGSTMGGLMELGGAASKTGDLVRRQQDPAMAGLPSWTPESLAQHFSSMYGVDITPEQVMQTYDAGAWPMNPGNVNSGRVGESFGDVGMATAGNFAPPTFADWMTDPGNAGGLAGIAGSVLGAAGQFGDMPELAQAGQGLGVLANALQGNWAGAAGGAAGLAGSLAGGDEEVADPLGQFGGMIGNIGGIIGSGAAGIGAAGAAVAPTLGTAAAGAGVPLAFMDLGSIIGGIGGQFSDYQAKDKEIFANAMSPWVDAGKRGGITKMEDAMEMVPGLIERTRAEGLGSSNQFDTNAHNYTVRNLDPNAHDYDPWNRQGPEAENLRQGPWREFRDEGEQILNQKKQEWIDRANQQGGVFRNVDGNQELMPFQALMDPQTGEATGKYQTGEDYYRQQEIKAANEYNFGTPADVGGGSE